MRKIAAILIGLCAVAANASAVKLSDISKLDAIIKQMSPRAQKEIKIDDKEAFLDELQIVLDEEKKFLNDGDLPLYFLIDKKHKAPDGYEPKNIKALTANKLYNLNKDGLSLRTDVELELQKMAKAAKNDGITLLVRSTYRSYEYQKNLFQYWVDRDGLVEAERESARPGTSQHQLGSAIDFGMLSNEFMNTPQGKWLYNNGWKYGWSLSFPQEYEDITGYRYESWHYRFIGIPACKFQRKYFNNVQQYMLEFIDLWKSWKA